MAWKLASLLVLLAVPWVARPVVPALLAIAIATFVLSMLPRTTRRIVATAMLGMATSNGAIILFATGVFQAPMTQEFGWTRTQYFTAVQLTIPGTVLMAPLIGSLLDRYGVRRVVLPSLLLLAALVGALWFLSNSLLVFYSAFALLPILGAGTSSAAWARLIATWFHKRRGLALGAALSGMGIGGALLSPLLQWLVETSGWRSGFVSISALLLGVTLPVACLWLRDTPQELGIAQDGVPLGNEADPVATSSSDRPMPQSGLTMSETLRNGRFWRIGAIFLVLGFAVGGLMFQLIPVLTHNGMAASEAAGVAGVMGLALVAGRAFSGYLLDRLYAPRVAMAFLLGPIAGALMLATGASGSLATIAGLLIGLAAGAEVDVLAYLVARYFGLRSYARSYGWLYAAWATGSGFGPLLAAQIYDRTGEYRPALLIYAALFGFACLLLMGLGAYPKLDTQTPAPQPTNAS